MISSARKSISTWASLSQEALVALSGRPLDFACLATFCRPLTMRLAAGAGDTGALVAEQEQRKSAQFSLRRRDC